MCWSPQGMRGSQGSVSRRTLSRGPVLQATRGGSRVWNVFALPSALSSGLQTTENAGSDLPGQDFFNLEWCRAVHGDPHARSYPVK